MTKVWQGPTPYDMQTPFDWSHEAERRAYVKAMNSPEVRALYEALRSFVELLSVGGEVPDMLQAMQVLGAYDGELQENGDG